MAIPGLYVVLLRSYVCDSISRLFAKHTDARRAGLARENLRVTLSLSLYVYETKNLTTHADGSGYGGNAIGRVPRFREILRTQDWPASSFG